jgi:hypothetical protein
MLIIVLSTVMSPVRAAPAGTPARHLFAGGSTIEGAMQDRVLQSAAVSMPYEILGDGDVTRNED